MKHRILLAGAGGGVGQEMANALSREGHDLALLIRRSPAAGQISASMDANDARLRTYSVDLQDQDESHSTLAQIWRDFEAIDLVINAVGGWIGGKRLHEHSGDDFAAMIGKDFAPTYCLTRLVLRHFLQQGHGKLINFSSMSALDYQSGSALYAASKAAVLTLTAAVAEEYRKDGIEAYAFAPGLIATSSNKAGMPDADHASWVQVPTLTQTALFLAEQGNPELSGTVFRFASD